MIVHNVVQGTDAWRKLRAGKVTASCADKIITPKLYKRSQSQESYMDFLLAEWMLGEPIETDASQFMKRGKVHESPGRAWFEFEYDLKVEPVGFITTDDGNIGCSPDGIVDSAEGLEIKTPGIVEHVSNLRDAMRAHWGQIQASIYITGFPGWWLLSYNPQVPSRAVLCDRDPKWADAFHAAMYDEKDGFLVRLEQAKRELVEMGFGPPGPPACGGISQPCGSREGLAKSEIGWLCSACSQIYNDELASLGMGAAVVPDG